MPHGRRPARPRRAPRRPGPPPEPAPAACPCGDPSRRASASAIGDVRAATRAAGYAVGSAADHSSWPAGGGQGLKYGPVEAIVVGAGALDLAAADGARVVLPRQGSTVRAERTNAPAASQPCISKRIAVVSCSGDMMASTDGGRHLLEPREEAGLMEAVLARHLPPHRPGGELQLVLRQRRDEPVFVSEETGTPHQ